MSNYVASFSMSELYFVGGSPLLWKILKVNNMGGFVVVALYSLTNPKKTMNARGTDISSVESTLIPSTYVPRISKHKGFTDPGIVTVSTVFEILDTLKFSRAEFEKQTKDERYKIMQDVIPYVDLDKFHISSFIAILRLYDDFQQAVSRLEPVEDPYDKISPEYYGEEKSEYIYK